MHRFTRALAAGLLSVAAACSGNSTGSSDTTGSVVVRVTDAPSDDFESATIFVSQVALIPSGGSASAAVVSNTKASFDLLTLQNGVTAQMAAGAVATGNYSQVRLLVDSARVVLKSGHTFADGSTTAVLHVPSGSESGLKVNFGSPVSVTTGQTVLVVDFNLASSFVFQGPSSHPNSVTLKPVIHATAIDVAGTISGTISPAVANTAVYAISGSDTVQTTFASSVDGSYTLHFLPPGNYVVAANATGFQASLSSALTLGAAQSMTGVNLLLVP